jgi:hypothetical protein
MKTCSKCNLELPFEQFIKNKSKKDGLRGECKVCVKKYREENKDKVKENKKKYQQEHKEERNEYQRNRRKTDEGFRILDCLRARIRESIRRNNKSASTMELVGCSIEFLRDYLENTKVEGKDYSDAHIDHIRPCASFDLTDPEQQRECFHYTNLQYLPAKENISKGARLEYNI